MKKPDPRSIALHWMRRDLRLQDNRALANALESGQPVICCFVFDRGILDRLVNKSDRRVAFIHRELHRIQTELNAHGAQLLVGYGNVSEIWTQWLEDFKEAFPFFLDLALLEAMGIKLNLRLTGSCVLSN